MTSIYTRAPSAGGSNRQRSPRTEDWAAHRSVRAGVRGGSSRSRPLFLAEDERNGAAGVHSVGDRLSDADSSPYRGRRSTHEGDDDPIKRKAWDLIERINEAQDRIRSQSTSAPRSSASADRKRSYSAVTDSATARQQHHRHEAASPFPVPDPEIRHDASDTFALTRHRKPTPSIYPHSTSPSVYPARGGAVADGFEKTIPRRESTPAQSAGGDPTPVSSRSPSFRWSGTQHSQSPDHRHSAPVVLRATLLDLGKPGPPSTPRDPASLASGVRVAAAQTARTFQTVADRAIEHLPQQPPRGETPDVASASSASVGGAQAGGLRYTASSSTARTVAGPGAADVVGGFAKRVGDGEPALREGAAEHKQPATVCVASRRRAWGTSHAGSVGVQGSEEAFTSPATHAFLRMPRTLDGRPAADEGAEAAAEASAGWDPQGAVGARRKHAVSATHAASPALRTLEEESGAYPGGTASYGARRGAAAAKASGAAAPGVGASSAASAGSDRAEAVEARRKESISAAHAFFPAPTTLKEESVTRPRPGGRDSYASSGVAEDRARASSTASAGSDRAEAVEARRTESISAVHAFFPTPTTLKEESVTRPQAAHPGGIDSYASSVVAEDRVGASSAVSAGWGPPDPRRKESINATHAYSPPPTTLKGEPAAQPRAGGRDSYASSGVAEDRARASRAAWNQPAGADARQKESISATHAYSPPQTTLGGEPAAHPGGRDSHSDRSGAAAASSRADRAGVSGAASEGWDPSVGETGRCGPPVVVHQGNSARHSERSLGLAGGESRIAGAAAAAAEKGSVFATPSDPDSPKQPPTRSPPGLRPSSTSVVLVGDRWELDDSSSVRFPAVHPKDSDEGLLRSQFLGDTVELVKGRRSPSPRKEWLVAGNDGANALSHPGGGGAPPPWVNAYVKTVHVTDSAAQAGLPSVAGRTPSATASSPSPYSTPSKPPSSKPRSLSPSVATANSGPGIVPVMTPQAGPRGEPASDPVFNSAAAVRSPAAVSYTSASWLPDRGTLRTSELEPGRQRSIWAAGDGPDASAIADAERAAERRDVYASARTIRTPPPPPPPAALHASTVSSLRVATRERRLTTPPAQLGWAPAVSQAAHERSGVFRRSSSSSGGSEPGARLDFTGSQPSGTSPAREVFRRRERGMPGGDGGTPAGERGVLLRCFGRLRARAWRRRFASAMRGQRSRDLLRRYYYKLALPVHASTLSSSTVLIHMPSSPRQRQVSHLLLRVVYSTWRSFALRRHLERLSRRISDLESASDRAAAALAGRASAHTAARYHRKWAGFAARSRAARGKAADLLRRTLVAAARAAFGRWARAAAAAVKAAAAARSRAGCARSVAFALAQADRARLGASFADLRRHARRRRRARALACSQSRGAAWGRSVFDRWRRYATIAAARAEADSAVEAWARVRAKLWAAAEACEGLHDRAVLQASFSRWAAGVAAATRGKERARVLARALHGGARLRAATLWFGKWRAWTAARATAKQGVLAGLAGVRRNTARGDLWSAAAGCWASWRRFRHRRRCSAALAAGALRTTARRGYEALFLHAERRRRLAWASVRLFDASCGAVLRRGLQRWVAYTVRRRQRRAAAGAAVRMRDALAADARADVFSAWIKAALRGRAARGRRAVARDLAARRRRDAAARCYRRLRRLRNLRAALRGLLRAASERSVAARFAQWRRWAAGARQADAVTTLNRVFARQRANTCLLGVGGVSAVARAALAHRSFRKWHAWAGERRRRLRALGLLQARTGHVRGRAAFLAWRRRAAAAKKRRKRGEAVSLVLNRLREKLEASVYKVRLSLGLRRWRAWARRRAGLAQLAAAARGAVLRRAFACWKGFRRESLLKARVRSLKDSLVATSAFYDNCVRRHETRARRTAVAASSILRDQARKSLRASYYAKLKQLVPNNRIARALTRLSGPPRASSVHRTQQSTLVYTTPRYLAA
ncbi:hypothetical protein DIPPA_25554 [Diplonema papillatum]|nr:hypothetical protein DIPPA_25554 [Diplonema papillatum]